MQLNISFTYADYDEIKESMQTEEFEEDEEGYSLCKNHQVVVQVHCDND